MSEADTIVGRTPLVDELLREIEEGGLRRLVITGRSGVGKSRIAMAVADRLDHRTVVVRAGGAHDAHELVVRLGRALGTTDAGRRIRPAVSFALGTQPTALLLDDCDPAGPVAPVVDELLSSHEELVVMMTAPSPLGSAADHVVRLMPLDLPATGEVDPEALRRSPAVRLFVERARSATLAFDPSERDLAAIGELCRRLDGLPLAIEIAASRIVLMEPSAMLREMGRVGAWQLVGLSLDDEVARSFDRLDAPSRETFLALSVFSGGASVEALHAVAGLESLSETIDAVSLLVDLHLVDADAKRARFALSSAASAFAAQRIAAGGHEQELRSRHALHFAETSRGRASAATAGKDGDLAIDHANRLQAATWLRSEGDVDLALRLMVDMAPDFERRGEPASGRELLIAFLVAAPAAAARTRARCHLWIARFEAERSGRPDIRGAMDHFTAARALADESGDVRTTFLVLNAICENHIVLGLDALAEAAADGLDRSRGSDHAAARAGFLGWSAVLAHLSGDERGAASVAAEAIRTAMSVDHRRLIMRTCLIYWALPTHVRKDSQGQYPSVAELVEMARAEHDLRAEGWLLAIATGIALEQDDRATATSTSSELLQLSLRTDNAPLGRLGLAAAIRIALEQGALELAATMIGAIDRHADSVGASMAPHAHAVLKRAMTSVRDALGTPAYEGAFQRGQATEWRGMSMTAARYLSGETVDVGQPKGTGPTIRTEPSRPASSRSSTSSPRADRTRRSPSPSGSGPRR